MIYVDTKDRVEQGVEEQKKAQEDIKKQFPGLDLPKIEAASLEHYGRVETLINAYDYNLDLVCLDLYFDVMEKQMDNMFKDLNMNVRIIIGNEAYEKIKEKGNSGINNYTRSSCDDIEGYE